MSAAVLREAARLMRDRAEGARPSPWNVDGPWWHNDDELGGFDATDMVTAGDERVAVAVTVPRDLNDNHDRDADMQHIASWHPAVALAVADWLMDLAARITLSRQLRHDDEELQALAVARAYLGAES